MIVPMEDLPPGPEIYQALSIYATDLVAILETDGTVRYASPSFERLLGYAPVDLQGTNAFDLVHPDEVAEVRAAFVAGIEADGAPVHVQYRYRHANGSWRVVESTGSSHLADPVVCGFVVNSRDITERVHLYDLLEQRVAERTRELSTLLELSHNVASTLELRPLLALILDQIRGVVDYSDASIQTLSGDVLVIQAYRGPESTETLVGQRISLARALANRRVIECREPVIEDDLWADSPLARSFQSVSRDDLGARIDHMRSWLGVPLLLKKKVIGMLSLAYGEPAYYTPRQATLALAIANQAAIAIENARLYEQAQEVAALEERQRLARELHDSVSQALYGIALGARTARTLLERDAARAAQPLEYVLTLAEAGLAEMRALIFELRPEALEQEGLVAALEKQVAAVQARHGLAVAAALGGEPGVAFVVKEALYRIAQEALHNVVKHAHARTIAITLQRNAAGIALEVCDDGAGFDADRAFPGHLGLRTMRERAERQGGALAVASAPGAGTCIRVQMPASPPASFTRPM